MTTYEAVMRELAKKMNRAYQNRDEALAESIKKQMGTIKPERKAS